MELTDTPVVEEGASRPSRDLRPLTPVVEEGAQRPSRDPWTSAVCFDLGNVLIAWEPVLAVAAGVGAERAAAFLAADDFDFMAWNHLQDSGGEWDAAEASVARSHPHWADAARAYRTHFGRSLTGEVPGTAALVGELADAGVPVYGLTNWSRELFPVALERFAVLGRLDDIVVSGTERVAKPDPAVFRILERRAGVPLAGFVFVDDSPRNVAAAAALGMDAILFAGAQALRSALRARGLPV